MNDEQIVKVSKKLNFKVTQVKSVITLLSEGSTIPFIARYRKEVTGNLNEEELRLIETEYNYQVNIDKRKDDVRRLIEEKGMLTDDIIASLNEAIKLSEVEDIYLPFKEKRKTKGTEAIKMGLEPLAKEIMTFVNKSAEELATPFLSDVVKTVDEAITNAGFIIADWVSEDAKYRKWIRNYFYYNGFVNSKLKKNAVDENKVYEIYYDFSQKITDVKPHRIFAINRASNEKIVTYGLSCDSKKVLDYLFTEVIGNKQFLLRSKVEDFISDAYKRLIEPSIERDIKSELFDNASVLGINEFGDNLENLLLTPPIKGAVVLGFDPAFRTGCKLAVLSEMGDVLDISVIYPHEPKNLVNEAEAIMLDLIKKHDVKIIAIGNGTASRESEAFCSKLISKYNLSIKYIIVSEAGASVYSASPLAKREFPDFSVEQRSAVSIGRRLQDALSELVKIDPKSIGVGLYQHDLKPKELDEQLSFVVSKVVNKVGVNLNNASESILSFVSGLNKSIIKKILDYKKKKGSIKSREELKKIAGVNDLVFEQSAGFLRIFDGVNALDKTNIHPEDYELVTNLLNTYEIDVSLVGTQKMEESLNKLDSKEIISKFNISLEKFMMIKNNLINGVIDPRDELKQMLLRSDILSMDDLEVGMSLEGTVRNVTAFGAFIDIGLHDDALVHISKMSKNFIEHPSEILKVGDIITVYICGIDKEKNRVSLSLLED
ncbi:MAG: Tex family protein [Bacilli bacterium]